MKIKIARIKEFLVDQYTVQVILNFKKRLDADVDVASLLMDNIVARLQEFADIDYSEKLTKDRKSVCVLKPLSKEKYAALGLDVDKQQPGMKRDKERKLDPTKEAERQKKLERKRRTKERLSGIIKPSVESSMEVTSLLDRYGESPFEIRRKRELLESGMPFPQVIKTVKREIQEREELEKKLRDKDFVDKIEDYESFKRAFMDGDLDDGYDDTYFMDDHEDLPIKEIDEEDDEIFDFDLGDDEEVLEELKRRN